MYRPFRYRSNLSKSGCLVLLLPFLLLACKTTQNAVDTNANTISVWHDDQRSVTCWIYAVGYKGGLACLPDNQIEDTNEN